MKKVKIPFDIMKEIINDYTLNNISVPQLNKKYHYSNTVLYRELRENNIQIKSFEDASRKYEINKNIFKQITEQSAYWMGFIVTDGSFQKRLNTYQLVIHLSNKDDNHLKKIREFIQPNVKITYTKENSCRIAFTSNEICNDIWKYGIGINKTKEVNLLECLIYNRDFWRGVVDGDGYLGYCEKGNNKHRLEIVGSYSLLSYFVEYCKTIIPNFKNTVKPHKSIYVIHLGGNTAKTILKSLYENSNIYLDRKKEKYEEIIAL